MKNRFFTCLLTLLFIVSIPIQAQEVESLLRKQQGMHEEKIGDPWMPNEWNNQKTTPAYRYQARLKSGQGTSVFTTQVNVDREGRNITGDAANEPSIAVSPVDPNIMTIGWRQFDNISSNFRQAGWGYTADGGRTWKFPGVIEPGVFRSDPVLDADASGKIYYNSLTNSPDYFCKVFGSTNGGETWDSGTDAHGGDKQWMVIDRTDGPGKGNIYSTWSYYFSTCAPGFFTRSVNDNLSYEPCIVAEGYAYWCTMAVGNAGELFIAGTAGKPDSLVVAKSINASDKAGAVTWLPPVTIYSAGNPIGWSGVNPGGLLGQVNIDIDRSQGPGRGNVYVLASVNRPAINDPCDVVFLRSTDGGTTWSKPMVINDDQSTLNSQWFGTMSVAPDGRIDAIWYDTRDASAGSDSSALYYSYSTDQGITWSKNERLSGLFDPHVGYPNQNKLGDYLDMSSDNSSAHLAWAATFNGEQDVYYSRITPPVVSGIGELPDAIPVQIFPNPAGDHVMLTGAPVGSEYEIRNSLGAVLLKGTVTKPQTSVSLSNLPRGIYFFLVTDHAGRVQSEKLIINQEGR